VIDVTGNFNQLGNTTRFEVVLMALTNEQKLFHDLRNGLTVILAHCEIVEMGNGSDTSSRVRVIREAATRMCDLVAKQERISQ
jgi:hypothetical protein